MYCKKIVKYIRFGSLIWIIDMADFILVPPKITPFSFARDLNVGDRTSVQCVIGTGDLPLTFTWLKDGQPLSIVNADQKQQQHQLQQQQLELLERATMRGDVSGGLSGTGDVTVGGGMTAVSGINRLTNDDGSSDGQGDALGQVTIRQNDDFTSALSITSVTRAQSGTYTCRVQNDAATVSHSAQLRVNGILIFPLFLCSIFKPSFNNTVLSFCKCFYFIISRRL